MSENIRIIQLSSYEIPEPKENKSKGWVLNGKHNSFYNELLDVYNSSPTHRAIVDNYASMIYGNGLQTGANLDLFIKVKQVIRPRELKKMIKDYEIYGTYSFMVVSDRGGELSEITHVPRQKLAPALADEDKNISHYHYCDNWEKPYTEGTIPLDVYEGGKKGSFVYVYEPNRLGNDYFGVPNYIAGLQYAILEKEISNYYVSHIKNGLSFGYIVNIPDGQSLSEDEKDSLEQKIKESLTGSSNAGKFILNFQMGDLKITVDVVQINDAHKQWQYLTAEARQQILTAHGVVSPMLFGIKDATGFGNNADELTTAREQLHTYKVVPKQQDFLEPLEQVFHDYGYFINFSFKKIGDTPNTELSEKKKSVLNEFLESCESEDDLTNDYDLVAECRVDDESEEDDLHVQFSTKTGVARPNSKSKQDFDTHIIRYVYAGKKTGERDFCNKMIQAKKIFRMEDLKQLKNKAVNPGFGEKGAATYDIWLYKGGARCSHYWKRQIYLKKGTSVDAKSPLAEIINVTKARAQGLEIPKNENKVGIQPRRMKNKGFINPPSEKDKQPGIV